MQGQVRNFEFQSPRGDSCKVGSGHTFGRTCTFVSGSSEEGAAPPSDDPAVQRKKAAVQFKKAALQFFEKMQSVEIERLP